MKKALALLLCVLMLAGVLAGCAGDAGQSSSSAQEESTQSESEAAGEESSEPATEGDVTLTVGASQNWIKDVDHEIADKFTEQTGIAIDFQVTPDDQYANLIKTKLATNEAPDIIYINCGVSMVSYQPDKYFMDLGDMEWVPKMKDWAISGSSYNGVLYGFNTWSVDGSGIMYNKQIFDQYNLTEPKNFEELKAICQTLLDNGIQPIYDNAKDQWHCSWWLVELANVAIDANPDFLTQINTGEAGFADNEGLVQALTDYKELYDLGYLGENALSNEWIPGYEVMGTGKAAMILTYSTYQNELAEQYPDSQADTWGMFPLMVGGCNKAALSPGGITRAVNANTKYADQIEQYFTFLTEEENVKTYYEARTDLGEPSVKDIEVRPLHNAYETFTAYNSADETYTTFDGIVMFWSDVVAGQAIQDMLLETVTPQEALAAIDADRAKSLETLSE